MDNTPLSEFLPEDLKTEKGLEKFKDGPVGNLAKSYLESESKINSIKSEVTKEFEGKMKSMLTIPGEDADESSRREFFSKLGCPEKSDGYSPIKVGDSDEEFFGGEDDVGNTVRTACHKVGITDNQYKAVMTELAKGGLVSLDNFLAQDKEVEKEAVETLTKEWGGEKKFNEKVELGKRLIKHYDKDSALSEFLIDTRLGSYAPLVKLLGNVASDILAEEITFTGESTGGERKEPKVELSPVTGQPMLKYDKSPELD